MNDKNKANNKKRVSGFPTDKPKKNAPIPMKEDEPIFSPVKEETDVKGSEVLDLNPTNLIQGIFLSELLGPPRCKRKGRWY